MTKSNQKMGFTYFSSTEQLVNQQLDIWMPSLQASGGAYVVFQGNFDVAIPEDAFVCALSSDLQPFVILMLFYLLQKHLMTHLCCLISIKNGVVNMWS